jgi:hypothetical protein
MCNCVTAMTVTVDKAVHQSVCEIEGYKQKNLMNHVVPSTCCCFDDITTLSDDKARLCLSHPAKEGEKSCAIFSAVALTGIIHYCNLLCSTMFFRTIGMAILKLILL